MGFVAARTTRHGRYHNKNGGQRHSERQKAFNREPRTIKLAMNRRSFCALGGVGLMLLSGCLFNSGPDSGSLIINNEHDGPHTVKVTIRKLENESAPVDTPSATPRPAYWERTYTYEVGATDQKTVPNLITEPGTFDIYTRLDTGVGASTRLSLYQGVNGMEVGGGSIAIDIYADSRVTAYTPNEA